MPNLNFKKENVLGHLIVGWENSNFRAFTFSTLVCHEHAKRLPIQNLDASEEKNKQCRISGCQNEAKFIYHFNE